MVCLDFKIKWVHALEVSISLMTKMWVNLQMTHKLDNILKDLVSFCTNFCHGAQIPPFASVSKFHLHYAVLYLRTTGETIKSCPHPRPLTWEVGNQSYIIFYLFVFKLQSEKKKTWELCYLSFLGNNCNKWCIHVYSELYTCNLYNGFKKCNYLYIDWFKANIASTVKPV